MLLKTFLLLKIIGRQYGVEILIEFIKGRLPYFSMQVVINKCFHLNPETKFGEDPSCRFREKRKKRTL